MTSLWHVFFRQYGEDGINKQLRRIPILHGLQPMTSCCRNHALRMSFSTMPGCRRIGERGWLPHYVQITGFCPLQHAAYCLRESYNISQYSKANVINAGSLVADSSILIVTTHIPIVMMLEKLGCNTGFPVVLLVLGKDPSTKLVAMP